MSFSALFDFALPLSSYPLSFKWSLASIDDGEYEAWLDFEGCLPSMSLSPPIPLSSFPSPSTPSLPSSSPWSLSVSPDTHTSTLSSSPFSSPMEYLTDVAPESWHLDPLPHIPRSLPPPSSPEIPSPGVRPADLMLGPRSLNHTTVTRETPPSISPSPQPELSSLQHQPTKSRQGSRNPDSRTVVHQAPSAHAPWGGQSLGKRRRDTTADAVRLEDSQNAKRRNIQVKEEVLVGQGAWGDDPSLEYSPTGRPLRSKSQRTTACQSTRQASNIKTDAKGKRHGALQNRRLAGNARDSTPGPSSVNTTGLLAPLRASEGMMQRKRKRSEVGSQETRDTARTEAEEQLEKKARTRNPRLRSSDIIGRQPKLKRWRDLIEQLGEKDVQLEEADVRTMVESDLVTLSKIPVSRRNAFVEFQKEKAKKLPKYRCIARYCSRRDEGNPWAFTSPFSMTRTRILYLYLPTLD
ncbi:hypothetical protein CVT25_003694 [Psilocybe cyanescens]|uniref:Uncharacterized protein n=1 Tax=Psilocybe cyanescens TaxID=93625 RepID=A0A409WP67_PSICY|nr:hypothetical protein CVT25_003694 [Psilocybe cyanescens]